MINSKKKRIPKLKMNSGTKFRLLRSRGAGMIGLVKVSRKSNIRTNWQRVLSLKKLVSKNLKRKEWITK